MPSSLAFCAGTPRITSTSSGRPLRQSVCMLLPNPGMANVLSTNVSANVCSSGTPHARPTSITSCISRRVVAIADGEECSQVCVSTIVRAVIEFQAAFQTTFSQRWRWMSVLSSTWKQVFPLLSKELNVDNFVSSRVASCERLICRPICRSSDFVCFTMPGWVCVAPTQVCAVSISARNDNQGI